MDRKNAGVTLGDPAGIGPEITAKLLLDRTFCTEYPFIPIGPRFVLDEAFTNILKIPPPAYEIIDCPPTKPFQIPYGTHSAQCGDVSMKAVECAVKMALKGQINAVVTCPINKHSVELAGYPYHGHTEYLGYLTGTADFSMMLASPALRVIPVTLHMPLRAVADSLKTESILRDIRNAQRAGKYFGFPAPRIAVTGLNPHAGDNNTLGTEEATIILPAIEAARLEGIDASGPHPADSLFAYPDRFDVAVAMYHDQALIPVKMGGFGNTVNITLNLPIIRTSVDHGTAFNIAGQGIANTESLKQAIIMAHHMAEHSKICHN